jgi:hypothetical protein
MAEKDHLRRLTIHRVIHPDLHSAPSPACSALCCRPRQTPPLRPLTIASQSSPRASPPSRRSTTRSPRLKQILSE